MQLRRPSGSQQTKMRIYGHPIYCSILCGNSAIFDGAEAKGCRRCGYNLPP
jgi:hypothetical protein